MNILERVITPNNWITLTFLFCVFLLFVLKLINAERLENYAKAFFLKGFIEKKTEEKPSFFSVFNLVLFLFSSIVVSLFLAVIAPLFFSKETLTFLFFCNILLGLITYLFVFYFLEFLLIITFNIKNELTCFITSKVTYFYNFALWLFPVIIISYYSLNTNYFSIIFSAVLFLMSVILVLINNKNLIVNKLFYFILYICALKIAPLLIIFKIML